MVESDTTVAAESFARNPDIPEFIQGIWDLVTDPEMPTLNSLDGRATLACLLITKLRETETDFDDVFGSVNFSVVADHLLRKFIPDYLPSESTAEGLVSRFKRGE